MYPLYNKYIFVHLPASDQYDVKSITKHNERIRYINAHSIEHNSAALYSLHNYLTYISSLVNCRPYIHFEYTCKQVLRSKHVHQGSGPGQIVSFLELTCHSEVQGVQKSLQCNRMGLKKDAQSSWIMKPDNITILNQLTRLM